MYCRFLSHEIDMSHSNGDTLENVSRLHGGEVLNLHHAQNLRPPKGRDSRRSTGISSHPPNRGSSTPWICRYHDDLALGIHQPPSMVIRIVHRSEPPKENRNKQRFLLLASLLVLGLLEHLLDNLLLLNQESSDDPVSYAVGASRTTVGALHCLLGS